MLMWRKKTVFYLWAKPFHFVLFPWWHIRQVSQRSVVRWEGAVHKQSVSAATVRFQLLVVLVVELGRIRWASLTAILVAQVDDGRAGSSFRHVDEWFPISGIREERQNMRILNLICDANAMFQRWMEIITRQTAVTNCCFLTREDSWSCPVWSAQRSAVCPSLIFPLSYISLESDPPTKPIITWYLVGKLVLWHKSWDPLQCHLIFTLSPVMSSPSAYFVKGDIYGLDWTRTML